jgi:hypothetical protein
MSEPASTPAYEPLLGELIERLADALAPRLAQLLSDQPPTNTDDHPSRRLLTIDQLVAQLPAGKKPQTWKSWLYQQTRHGHIPGCYRLGGRLFFNPDETLPWLLGTNARTAAGLDLSPDQSLHAQPMAHEATQRPRPGRGG